MQDALDWGQRYMTQAEWDGINEEHEEHEGNTALMDGDAVPSNGLVGKVDSCER
jgi:hypothetical protein